MKKVTVWLYLAVACSGLADAAAPTPTNTANITVTVTIIARPCEINHNQVIDIDFGNEVVTTDVAKGMYEKPVNYTLDCSNADSTQTLKMRISGNAAAFDNDVLQTSVSALGIKLKADGMDFPLNSDMPLASPTSKPALTALLVQQPGSRLPTGEFTAAATMTVDYQ